MRAQVVCLAWLLAACGVQRHELAPRVGDVIVLDPVAPASLRLLQDATTARMEPGLSLAYPADGTAIPANLAPVTFGLGMRKPKGGMMMEAARPEWSAFELHIVGANVDLRVYTTQPNAVLPDERWRRLLAEHVEQDLTLSVRAVAVKDARVAEGKPTQLSILHPLASGAIYYWSEAQQTVLRAGIDARQASVAADPGSYSSVIASAESASPDGRSVVFALAAKGAMEGMMMMMEEGSSIARASVAESGERGAPELLVSAGKGEALLSPSYAPDGELVVFERRKGKDKEGTLWIVPAAGGTATQIGAGMMGAQAAGSSPSFLPSSVEGERWLVFSSARALPDHDPTPDQLQLWALAVSETAEGALAARGQAFWLPFQDVTDSNAAALWQDLL